MSKPSPEVLKVKEKYEEELLKIKGVVGVGANHSIIIYVEKLTPQLAAWLPRTLEGIPVRVVEVGKVKPLISTYRVEPLYASRVRRYRPVPGGVSIGHVEITAGTLTCTAVDAKTGEKLGLSCNHVIALQWHKMRRGRRGDPVIQPGKADGGRYPDDTVGFLERWVDVKERGNLVDAAVFTPSTPETLSDSIAELGRADRVVEPEVGMKVVKSGRTTGVSYSAIFDTCATIKVEGWGEAIFQDQVVVKPAFSAPGDSGSPVLEAGSSRFVGMVFAGSTEVTIVNKAQHIERLLGIEVVPPLPHMPRLSVALAAAAAAAAAAPGRKR